MDGARRLRESMMAALAAIAPARLRGSAASEAPSRRRLPPRARAPRRTAGAQLLHAATRRGVGLAFAFAFVASTAAYGFVRGGAYDSFVAQTGGIGPSFARMLGFGVGAIALTGQKELTHAEIVQASGITERDSVPFLDAQAVRARLKAMPLVREATVRKLYPDQVVLSIVERTPFALWQVDGEVSIIAADGAAIDQMRDQRFVRLPFVVGEGANLQVADYLKIIEAAGDFKSRIAAGVLVGQRRWNLKLSNGVDVRLPEKNPEEAVVRLAALARSQKLPDKDVIAIDLRFADRISVRLSEEAAATRLEAKTKKSRPKGSGA